MTVKEYRKLFMAVWFVFLGSGGFLMGAYTTDKFQNWMYSVFQ